VRQIEIDGGGKTGWLWMVRCLPNRLREATNHAPVTDVAVNAFDSLDAHGDFAGDSHHARPDRAGAQAL
jgi:hypothetical protein